MLTPRSNPYLGAPRQWAEHDAAIAEQMLDNIAELQRLHHDLWALLEYDDDVLADFSGGLTDLKTDTWAVVLANCKERLEAGE